MCKIPFPHRDGNAAVRRIAKGFDTPPSASLADGGRACILPNISQRIFIPTTAHALFVLRCASRSSARLVVTYKNACSAYAPAT